MLLLGIRDLSPYLCAAAVDKRYMSPLIIMNMLGIRDFPLNNMLLLGMNNTVCWLLLGFVPS